MEDRERDALLTLMLTPGIRHGLARRCLDTFGSAVATLGVSARDFARLDRVTTKTATQLRRALDQALTERALAREQELLAHHGVRVMAMTDSDYPRLLGHIPDPPVMLWVRGELRADDALALAVVGARRCTHYGREQASRFGSLGAEAGLCIVSGGARGVDAEAHRGALRAGGRTIAILGSGLANPYPADHAELFDQIAAQGAVVSELSMTTPPIAQNFPARNRIISGLALGVLVVEAALRSGALITARLCVEEHGRELMALPGRADSASSAGCHKIIRQGWATLVTNVADVLDALGEAGQLLKVGVSGRETDEPAPSEPGLSPVQTKIIGSLDEARTLDKIAAWTNLTLPQVQAELTWLEIRGAVKRDRGLFVRRGSDW